MNDLHSSHNKHIPILMATEINLQSGDHDNLEKFPSVRDATISTLQRRVLSGKKYRIIDGRKEEIVILDGPALFQIAYRRKAIAEI